jgi:hypothetical protein
MGSNESHRDKGSAEFRRLFLPIPTDQNRQLIFLRAAVNAKFFGAKFC